MELDALIDRLNDLIRSAEDNHLALQRAATDLGEERWSALCTELATRRGDMIRALQEQVAAIGGAPDATGTFIGGARRLVEELGVALGARHADDILEGLVKLQEATIDHILHVLDAEMPEQVQADLNALVVALRQDRDRLSGAHREAVAAEGIAAPAPEQGG